MSYLKRNHVSPVILQFVTQVCFVLDQIISHILADTQAYRLIWLTSFTIMCKKVSHRPTTHHSPTMTVSWTCQCTLSMCIFNKPLLRLALAPLLYTLRYSFDLVAQKIKRASLAISFLKLLKSAVHDLGKKWLMAAISTSKTILTGTLKLLHSFGPSQISHFTKVVITYNTLQK